MAWALNHIRQSCKNCQDIAQCRALWFMVAKVSWVGDDVGGEPVFLCNISGLRRPKNISFGTNAASRTSMMCTLRFLEKVFNVAKFGNPGLPIQNLPSDS